MPPPRQWPWTAATVIASRPCSRRMVDEEGGGAAFPGEADCVFDGHDLSLPGPNSADEAVPERELLRLGDEVFRMPLHGADPPAGLHGRIELDRFDQTVRRFGDGDEPGAQFFDRLVV